MLKLMNEDTLADDIIIEPENNDEFGGKDPKEIILKLKEKVKKLEDEKSEYLLGWQRTKADYANLKRQEEESKKELVKFANENLMLEIIPALDSFDMAMKNKEAWEKVDKNWRSGIEYIYKTLLQNLSASGLIQEDPVGIKLDASKHQSIESVTTDDEKKDHTIAEVVQKGYSIGEKNIRPAIVKIFEYKNANNS